MQSAALQAFLKASLQNQELQRRAREVRSLNELVRVAQEFGFALSARELQLWAHHTAFDAPWWPWASQDRDQRSAFFRG